MINLAKLEKIKDLTREFFQKTGIEAEIEVRPPQNLTIPVSLNMEEPQILIGERGQTLTEIQHLLKLFLRKKIEEPFYLDLDINDYKKKKIEYLKELARSAADEVALTKKEKELSPMPAYERRVIHLALASRSDVTTASLGQEPERRVVIRAC